MVQLYIEMFGICQYRTTAWYIPVRTGMYWYMSVYVRVVLFQKLARILLGPNS
jgi:hypothetical protein